MFPYSPTHLHTPTRDLTTTFNNSHASPGYTTGYMGQTDMSARTGTALFNSPAQNNGIVAVSPAASLDMAWGARVARRPTWR
jgi:hypothetical protein